MPPLNGSRQVSASVNLRRRQRERKYGGGAEPGAHAEAVSFGQRPLVNPDEKLVQNLA